MDLCIPHDSSNGKFHDSSRKWSTSWSVFSRLLRRGRQVQLPWQQCILCWAKVTLKTPQFHLSVSTRFLWSCNGRSLKIAKVYYILLKRSLPWHRLCSMARKKLVHSSCVANRDLSIDSTLTTDGSQLKDFDGVLLCFVVCDQRFAS